MCSYLAKVDMWPSHSTFCGIQPQISLSLYATHKKSRSFFVKRSFTRSLSRKLPPCIFGLWIPDACLSVQHFISAQARDEDKLVSKLMSDALVSKQYLCDLDYEDIYDSTDISDAINKGSDSSVLYRIGQPVEEPWILQPSLPSNCVGETDEDNILYFLNRNTPEPIYLNESAVDELSSLDFEDKLSALDQECIDLHETPPETDFPVEEPWLFQQSLPSPSDHEVKNYASRIEESVTLKAPNLKPTEQHPNFPGLLPIDEYRKESIGEPENLELHEQLQEVSEELFIDKDTRDALQGDSMSTLILINSSLCTMQRIAVLEDEKLVELLLEPVKTSVQCDSVYLGVVTKLVPQMGGAFVDIGCSRPSLMEIKHNREPFIFPPFCNVKKRREANDSLLVELQDHQDEDENGHNSFDAEVIDDFEEHDIIDDFEDHEIEDGFHVSELRKENSNGSLVATGLKANDEKHSESFSDSHDSLCETSREIPADIGGSHIQDMKDHKAVHKDKSKWARVKKGTKIIVQVVKEGLGTKGPTLTPYPKLRSRFWILSARCKSIGLSKKISGVERTRLRVIAKSLQPKGFGLIVRTVAAGQPLEELQKDLEGLLSTWKGISEHAKSAALAADEGVEGAIPVMLHRAMGQTLSVVQDYFNDKVKRMIVDSSRTYHEVTNYLQEIAPDLCDRVELYSKKTPLFDAYNIEEELNNMLSKRVPLSNGGYLVIEQTEALVSIDVNGGHCMFGQGTSQEKAIFDVNLAAAKQIAREIRLRDIGGIIVVDFIDMSDETNKRRVYEEVKKAVERDRSIVKVSELSRHGLMEMTRKRVRPSVTFMISEPCTCCNATGRVEALETSFSKIEHEICRLLALRDQKPDPGNPKSWPKFILRVDQYMCNYLTSGKRTRLAILSSSLKVWLLLKVARGFTRGAFELKTLTDDKDHKNQSQVAISLLRPTEVRNSPSGKVTIFPIKKWRTGVK